MSPRQPRRSFGEALIVVDDANLRDYSRRAGRVTARAVDKFEFWDYEQIASGNVGMKRPRQQSLTEASQVVGGEEASRVVGGEKAAGETVVGATMKRIVMTVGTNEGWNEGGGSAGGGGIVGGSNDGIRLRSCSCSSFVNYFDRPRRLIARNQWYHYRDISSPHTAEYSHWTTILYYILTNIKTVVYTMAWYSTVYTRYSIYILFIYKNT